jgi:triosephosphate isomerase
MLHKKLIIGNWKMNYDVHQSSLYVHQLSELVRTHRGVEVVLAPTLLALQSLSLQVNHRQFKLAAQNIYWRDHGAFTGEVSANQIRGVAQYAIVGHSERRLVFNESDKDTRRKVAAVLRNGMQPVLCVGETAFEKSENETADVLHDQVTGGLSNITSDEIDRVAIAYEPVWAIGTGNNANPDDVAKAVATIRNQVKAMFGGEASKAARVLYGGSVSIDNARAYLDTPGVDGLLIGGASLNAVQFNVIIEAAHDTYAAQTQKRKTK